jgi:alkylated DNA repair dioxygenase AlkB
MSSKNSPSHRKSDVSPKESPLKEVQEIKLKKGGYIKLYKSFLSKEEADELFRHFRENMPWQQSDITVYGKKFKTPRFQCFMSEEGVGASVYSKNRVKWTEEAVELKKRLEELTNFEYDYLLCNLYKTGQNYISWHSDKEAISFEGASEGSWGVISSLSLGGARKFKVKESKPSETPERYDFVLESGDLLIMNGEMQLHYKHTVPKTAKKVDERINLTYRRV